MLKWDEWRGSMDGRPTLWVKHLLCGRGYHIDLHKMVGPDDAECFHTHPAFAVRVVLWGGYLEEIEGGRTTPYGVPIREVAIWKPGRVGLVRPELCHRIARIYKNASYSLWIRFPKCAAVYLRGEGWQRQKQTFRAPNTVIHDHKM